MADMADYIPEYKIGEVSKLFGIPAETLRYYETCGILSPRKDSVSGYRSFTPWDVNYLLGCRLFRSYGFPLNEVQQILHEDNLDTLLSRYTQREAELIETIRRYQKTLQSLAAQRRFLLMVEQSVGRLLVEYSPELLLLRYRHGYELDLSEKTVALFHKWLQALPLVTHCIEVPQYSSTEAGVDLTEEYDDTRWGLTIGMDEAAQLGLKLEPPVEYIPPRKSVHIILAAGEKGTMLTNFAEQVLQPILAQGFQPCGDALGQVMAMVQKDGQFTRYFEMWVPIK